MEGNEKDESKNLEREVFKALDHEIRRDILRYVGEKRSTTFTDIMNAIKIPDSPTLSYHLKSLAPFIEQQNGKYQLTSIGTDAYNLLLKTATYNKFVFHMGMTMTEEELERWHREQPEITQEQHETWMKKMGVSKKEDENWHRTHETPPKRQNTQGKKSVNPFAIGGGFLDYCVRQGWLIQEGKGRSVKYYVTKEGEEKIRQFGIKI
jgi:predicted transcriptional regulator